MSDLQAYTGSSHEYRFIGRLLESCSFKQYFRVITEKKFKYLQHRICGEEWKTLETIEKGALLEHTHLAYSKFQ